MKLTENPALLIEKCNEAGRKFGGKDEVAFCKSIITELGLSDPTEELIAQEKSIQTIKVALRKLVETALRHALLEMAISRGFMQVGGLLPIPGREHLRFLKISPAGMITVPVVSTSKKKSFKTSHFDPLSSPFMRVIALFLQS